jgi:hypothetical protein
MDYADLFGEGAVYNNGSLGIPKANLEAVGLSVDSKVSTIAAILLLVDNYFFGELADSDNAILVDEDGNSIGFFLPVEDINSRFIRKQYNFEGNSLLWDWEISFYA